MNNFSIEHQLFFSRTCRAVQIAATCEGISESEFNAAWAEGQSMSQEQVLALAMEVLQ